MGRAESRLAAARGLLASSGIDALVVSRIENVRYLSGFTGSSAALLISESTAVLVTDSRYAEQSAAEAPCFQIDVVGGAPAIAGARRAGAVRVGFEAEVVAFDAWEAMRHAVQDKAGGVLVPCRGLIEGLRIIKDPEEIALIQRAVDITSDAFEQTLPLVVAGAVERDLALEIEFRMKQAGAEELAFDLIVASGPRSSLPHGRAAERRLGQGEFVVFDIGARFKGYHSDMTRTVYLGRPDDKATRIYRTVLESQLLGIESVRPGVTANDVDAAARGYIERTGHAGRFGHGTGHGVGLQIHEAPRVGPRSEEVLRAGMVLTVEPGIYIPGEGGVRIEDIVVVTDTGHRVMTPTRKDRWALE
ncbi:MAG TPA: aminopeptidase P family protein [Patescibacteria group bacterium]|nr:aminopeptidase P family protein [Patescibacteria group bacterium]